MHSLPPAFLKPSVLCLLLSSRTRLISMARSIQQIKNELVLIEEAVKNTSTELFDVNVKYLDLLGKLAAKQLVFSTYQLCTQVYPDSFLKLSYDRREKLQQNIKSLGKKLANLLFNSLDELSEDRKIEQQKVAAIFRDLNVVEQMLEGLPPDSIDSSERETNEARIDRDNEDDREQEINNINDNEIDEENEDNRELNEEEINDLEEQLNSDNLMFSTEEDLIATESEENNEEDTEEINIDRDKIKEKIVQINNPEELWKWQKQVEKKIKKALENISKQANKYLQEYNILPDRIPSKIIELAAQSEEAASAVSGVANFPNILNLVIETDTKEKSKKSKVVQVTILRLRLSEIEFVEPTLNIERGQIRSLIAKVEQLKQQYRRKQQECKIAEAEAAWRSSWYEE
jgi:DNA repair exonuclease SbcCD ATPase subunit